MSSPPVISGSRRRQPRRSRAWSDAPALVAETLVAVREPLLTVLRPGSPAPAPQVASALGRSLGPLEAGDVAPEWLWLEQIGSYRRALAAVRCYGGALLADPVGTGKTYVALAVAAALNRAAHTTCFVPAALMAQWREAARKLDLPVRVWSHERVSRGALPRGGGRLALVDESHHFRNPDTRRYHHLARWLVGRQALLISASPIVNRLSDLHHQLALTIRDDGLARHGVPSIGGLVHSGDGHCALGHVIVVRPSATPRRPLARTRTVALDDSTLAPLDGALAEIDRLRLSTSPAIAALVRAAFWKSAASSPAALLASLDRYRRLLLHARDAAEAGQLLGRQTLRALTGGLDDQLLFWELLGAPDCGSELTLDDLPTLDLARAAVGAAALDSDAKVARLGAILADGRCTLVFACARATVRYLRDRLGVRPIAWCTGERAGVGRQGASRRAVLDWFRPGADAARGNGALEAPVPGILLTTDVAAEGLDLQRAERVIHYDLPWTPARLEQREGRVRRAGAVHAEMEIVQFEPPPLVEARLRQLACLAAKRRLPVAVGLDQSSRALWRWRVDMAERYRDAAAASGVALVRAPPEGVLAGFALHSWPDVSGTAALASWVVWWDAARGWIDDHRVIAERLDSATAWNVGRHESCPAPCDGALRSALALLAPLIRDRTRDLRQSRWLDATPGSASRKVIARLQALVRVAARRRDAGRLAQLQNAIRFAGGGHTAGERALLATLSQGSNRELERALVTLPPPSPAWEAIQCRLTGLIVFSP